MLEIFSWILRKYPFKCGLTRLAGLTWIQKAMSSREPEIVTPLRDGTPIRVSLRDFNGQLIYLFGSVDPKIVDICTSLSMPNDIFLDIGANHGVVGFFCHPCLENSGQVHFFEPQPDLCERIEEVISSQHMGSVFLHRYGLMDRDATLTFSNPSGHSGAGSFVSQSSQATTQRILPVRNVATVLPAIIGDREFAAKVDIEGGEIYVLPWLISQERLRYVLFESVALTESDSIYNAFINSDFILFGVIRSLFRTKVQRIQTAVQFRSFRDILAVRLRSKQIPKNVLSVKQLRRYL